MSTPKARRIYCNRTLNLRSIQAIGYDMDYTLIHYRVDEWESHAYAHTQRLFESRGWPVSKLSFDPDRMIRGLIIDTELGNVLKANRFGFVKRAHHGTRPIPYEEMRKAYSGVIVDLGERRFKFMNTLFSLSEATLYAQLVDMMDAGELENALGYEELYRQVRSTVDYAHLEGRLKGDIMADPDRFVSLDAETPLALLDQHHAGKKLILITNSGWRYTLAMMRYAFERYLPSNMKWEELFDLIIVEARKPTFFSQSNPAFEIVNQDGLLTPVREKLERRGRYVGGNASMVEACLDLEGDQVLYVGDHLFSDVHVTKNIQRWRTALVLREIEEELDAMETFASDKKELEKLMAKKTELEGESYSLKLALQRRKKGYALNGDIDKKALARRLETVRQELLELDQQIKPLAERADQVSNASWGPLMRAGNDKSHLAQQVEQYADIYLSRVSNFVHATPFAYMRSARGTLPHDPDPIPDERVTEPVAGEL
ncbi:MAG: HAD-IG family 5'-nucleotidase [Myxococcota bacterium]